MEGKGNIRSDYLESRVIFRKVGRPKERRKLGRYISVGFWQFSSQRERYETINPKLVTLINNKWICVVELNMYCAASHDAVRVAHYLPMKKMAVPDGCKNELI